jgi:PTS system ascorbate-specific IIA component
MIGILIIAHGTLGDSLIHSATHVLNKLPERVVQIGVGLDDDPAAITRLAQQQVRELDEGDGVLVLSDIYGATPCNIAMKLMVPGKIEGVAGVSLPMLIRALTYRDRGIRVIVAKAVSGGRDGVVHINRDICRAANSN